MAQLLFETEREPKPRKSKAKTSKPKASAEEIAAAKIAKERLANLAKARKAKAAKAAASGTPPAPKKATRAKASAASSSAKTPKPKTSGDEKAAKKIARERLANLAKGRAIRAANLAAAAASAPKALPAPKPKASKPKAAKAAQIPHHSERSDVKPPKASKAKAPKPSAPESPRKKGCVVYVDTFRPSLPWEGNRLQMGPYSAEIVRVEGKYRVFVSGASPTLHTKLAAARGAAAAAVLGPVMAKTSIKVLKSGELRLHWSELGETGQYSAPVAPREHLSVVKRADGWAWTVVEAGYETHAGSGLRSRPQAQRAAFLTWWTEALS